MSGAPAELGTRGRELLAHLRRRSEGEAEVYEKRGRSRRFERGPLGESSSQSVEAGWAVRGGDRRRSFFVAGSGAAPLELAPIESTPQPLRLPPPLPSRSWTAPSGLDAPLASESEGRNLLAGIARELARELAGAQLVTARLDEGASESALISTLGVEARVRARSTALRLEARRGALRVEAEFVARALSELKPLAIARRVADRLTALAGDGTFTAPSRLLLAAPVGARLLEAFAPRLVGAAAAESLRSQAAGGRAVAASAVTLIDDGRRVDGLLSAPFDGEGVPTGAATLVDRGELVAPLVAWWELDDPARATGCVRRPGWRDLPRRGPTELAIASEAGVAVADLVADLGSGAYLIATESGVRLEADGDRFSVAVSGYAIEDGRAAGALGPCRLHGSLSAWLLGFRALARDFAFVPGAALFGAPSALVEGLELTVGGE